MDPVSAPNPAAGTPPAPAASPSPASPAGAIGAAAADAAPAPLAGVRVVELAHWMAGPLAAGLLQDWGAEVIKVEPPGGDPMRNIYASLGARGDAPNGAFIVANRGKRSVELEIKAPEDRAALDRLLAAADVFVTNLRPDALARLGLAPEAVRARFPRLVYCSLSAYGWGGPDQDRPGYDIAAFFGRTGIAHEITTAGAAPAALMQGIGDSFAALAAASGVMAALLERHRTGRGQFVEASLLRTGMWALAGELGVQALGGNPRPPYPREESRTPLYNSYCTADGRWFFLVGVEAKRHLPSVLKAIGREDLIGDERFASARGITKHRDVLIPILDTAFGAQPLAYWAQRFDACDVWWAPIQTPAEVTGDAQADAAGGWIDVVVGEAGEAAAAEGADEAARSKATVRSVDAPIRFDGRATGARCRPPRSGEHTREVLDALDGKGRAGSAGDAYNQAKGSGSA